MDTIRPKNWAKFQHYKDRSPPWIKLHREILDDFDYASLPLASKALAPLLWLLAADNMEGDVPADPARLAHRLRWSLPDVVEGLKPLLDKGFMVLASGLLAQCLQDAIPETETETETETYKVEEIKATVRATPAPDDQFASFWDAYPVKKGKEAARKAWLKLKLTVEEQDAIIVRVFQQKMGDYDWSRGFCPHPATYLNGKRWNDEIGRPKPADKPAPSKTMQTMQLLQDMKNGLDRTGNSNGVSDAGFFEHGPSAGFGRIANDG